jgi:hypothetical protein
VAKAKKIGRQVAVGDHVFRDVAAADRQASLRAADPSRQVCLSCTPMNASAANFLTQESAGVCANVRRAITQLLSGSCAQAPSRPESHARHAPGRSGATSLARRRAQLQARLRDGRELSPEPRRCSDQPDDGEVRFPEDVSRPSHSQKTCGRHGGKTMDTGRAPMTVTVRQLGRERPLLIAWGEVGRRKPRVAHAPVFCTNTSAL